MIPGLLIAWCYSMGLVADLTVHGVQAESGTTVNNRHGGRSRSHTLSLVQMMRLLKVLQLYEYAELPRKGWME